jgi:hypothetical protein
MMGPSFDQMVRLFAFGFLSDKRTLSEQRT